MSRILIVEDDERIRSSMRLALEDEGYTVEDVASGEEAVARFDEDPFELVLIDLMLPGHRRVRDLPEPATAQHGARSSWSPPAPTPTTWWPDSRPGPTTT